MKSTLLRRFALDNRGATAVEYGLIVALIVITMIASLNSFAGASIAMFNNVSDKVSDARPGGGGDEGD